MYKIAIIIVIILFLIYYNYIFNYYKYGYYNTSRVNLDANYNVHNEHEDKKSAAKMLMEINKRTQKLIKHLEKKYESNNFRVSMDPNKNNHIDIVETSDIYANMAINSVKQTEYIQERIKQLINKYDPDRIYEISPLNPSGLTSYTQDKKTLIFCLRKKQKNKNGENELHDLNTIMFVVLHELTHMMNNTWGHKPDFWVLFKFMLVNAVEAKIYTPVDYSKYPIIYCGLALTYNPYYDPKL